MIRRFLFLTLFFCISVGAMFAREARLMRFPDIYNNQVVFTYAGNLYSVTRDGGVARQLTSDVGYEMFAHFSPSGKKIAFTGQYDGNTEVYLMDSDGGIPVRLTFTPTLKRDDVGDRMGPNNIVMGWSPDGKNVIFRSRWQTGGAFTGQLYSVDVESKVVTQLPLHVGGFCSYNSDGTKLAMNKVFREFRTWKYYKGGMADDIWIFDSKKGEVERIIKNDNQDIIPMWIGDKIYYLSDRDRTTNLFVYNVKTKEDKKLTQFEDYDVRFPGFDNKNIVFTKGGYLMTYDLASGKSHQIPVEIQNDQIYARTSWHTYDKEIGGADISPKGNRLLLSARGELFSVPVKEGVTYNLTNNSGANDRDAVWSPKGDAYAYISDKDGEFRIWISYLDGRKERCLTPKMKTYIYGVKWSNDGSKIAFTDKQNNLYYIDLKTKKRQLVIHSDIRVIEDYNWSVDGQWISFTMPNHPMDRIAIYSLESKQTQFITDGWTEVGNPVFSTDGNYLLFTTNQTFNPTYSYTEWNHAYVDMSNICMFLLNKKVPSPFKLKNDVVEVASDIQNKTKEKELDPIPVEIDFSNISERMVYLPVKSGYYWNIASDGMRVYYNRAKTGTGYNTYVYDLEKKKETALGKFMWTASYDLKHFMILKDNKIKVLAKMTSPVKMDETVDLSQMTGWLDLRKEWNQIYNECWRQMRDYFYARNMHGVDWDKIHDKYEALVPYVSHRSDLTFVIGEMIGELNVGHAYSANGKHPEPDRIYGGYLGAKIEKSQKGYFQIKKLLKSPEWNQNIQSPLMAPGLNVKEGDYIVSVNGHDISSLGSIYQALVGMAGKTVILNVNSVPSAKDSREILVKPIASEDELYYYNWVQDNIAKVDKASNGMVGYIHIPDMGPSGLNMFARLYYPQLRKKGLIIDDRFNGGGNVSPMITERLKRTPTFYTMHTNQKEGSVSPVGTHVGPKVLLCNGYSASDGDLFPYRFKKNKLGTVIGTRTWGGVVGYSGYITCVDGGHIVTPSYAPFANDGSKFIIEGHGVEPDIVVENDPYKEFMGEDAQLNKAVEVILKQIEKHSPVTPAIPKFPNKSK